MWAFHDDRARNVTTKGPAAANSEVADKICYVGYWGD